MSEMPPYAPPQSKGGKNTKVVVGVTIAAALLVVGMCGGLIYGVYRLVMGTADMVSSVAQCPITFSMTTEAAKAYAAENGGKLPPAATWQKDLAPYYEKLTGTLSEKTKDIPLLKIQASPIGEPLGCSFGEKTALVYNLAVAGKKISDIKKPAETPLFFEKVGAPKLNYAEAYKAGGAQPKMAGEPRELIVFYVEGNKDPFDSSSGEADLKIDYRDALPKTGEGGSAPALPSPGGGSNAEPAGAGS